MGIFSDILASRYVDSLPERTALDRDFVLQLEKLVQDGDAEYPGASWLAKNEIQFILNDLPPSSGTWDLTFFLDFPRRKVVVSDIAYDADDTEIESDIDSVMSGKVPGWSDGDISVTGGPLWFTDIEFTFSGASVSGRNHEMIIADYFGLTGGGIQYPPLIGSEGQTKRMSWAALTALGFLSNSTVPPTQNNPIPGSFSITANSVTDSDFVRRLIEIAADEDNNLQTVERLQYEFGFIKPPQFPV
jgi:hypothetical protein